MTPISRDEVRNALLSPEPDRRLHEIIVARLAEGAAVTDVYKDMAPFHNHLDGCEEEEVMERLEDAFDCLTHWASNESIWYLDGDPTSGPKFES